MTKESQPLKGDDLAQHHSRLSEWNVVGEHHLQRVFKFPDFASALKFVNRVGALAEQANHHPDLALGWGRVEITSHTHSIGGLSEKDFALARQISDLTRD